VALTDIKLRQVKATGKAHRLPDGGGLHLFVTPAGVRSWRWRYEIAGREQTKVLGRYPDMSLVDARSTRNRLRDKLRAGLPLDAAEPKAPPPAPTLTETITAWHASQAPLWKPHHSADVRDSLTVEIEATLGALPLPAVTPALLLDVLKAIQARGAVELAHRLRQRLSAAYGYAIAAGTVQADPAAHLSRLLLPVVQRGRRAALIGLDEVRAMLARAETIPAHPVVRLATRLMALTALRPGELRHGAWVEIEGETWRVPAARMKGTQARAATREDHLVPLANQVIEALAVLRSITGGGALMFPSPSDARRPISENTVGYLLNRAGYAGRQTAHGFRATFSTIMNERHPADRAVIDLMLAHTPTGAVEAAYNRAQHLDRRRALAQMWADLIMDGRPAAVVLMELPRR